MIIYLLLFSVFLYSLYELYLIDQKSKRQNKKENDKIRKKYWKYFYSKDEWKVKKKEFT